MRKQENDMGPCRKPTLDRSAPLGFSAALLLLASLTATQADAQTTPLTTPLTLAQAQRLLVTSSPELRLERLGTDKAEAQVSEARSAYWPSLDVFGSYQALTEKNHIAITLPPPSNTHIDRTMGDYDREEYAVDLTLPLFGGGARRQQVLSRTAAVYATQAGTQAQENALALRLAAIYCAWHSADAAGKVQGEVATRYRDYAERVTAQVKQGAALPSQASTARARWLNAQAELQAAQDNRDSIGRAAALLLGLSPETPVTFAAEAPAASLVTSGLTSAATRPDLLALDRSAESLDHQQSGLIGQRFPSLTGMVGYRLANPGLNLGTNDYMHYGVFGLQARWNLFDGFRNRSQRAQLEAQQASVRVDKERRSAAWTEAEHSADRRLARMELSLQAARAALEAARETQSEKEAQHRQGAATDLERIDSQVQTLRAAQQVENLEWQQVLATWQKRFANGETMMFLEGG